MSNDTDTTTLHAGCNAATTATSEFDQNSWIIAICLAILAAVSNNLGVNFQKLAWTQRQRACKTNTEGLLSAASLAKFRVVWTMGMLGIVLASVLDFVALAFGPQSVIAPIGALTIVMNGCVASYLHGERVTRTIVLCSLVICSGCALAVATASHANVVCSVDGIFAYFTTGMFAGYAVFMFVALTGMFFFTRAAERVFVLHGDGSDEYARWFPYHRVSYAFTAGMYGSVSVVFARAIGQLVMSSSRGGELFLLKWETYLVLVALVVALVMQMVNLNNGLSRFESSYNVPTFTGTFIVSVAVSGGVVYGEFAHFSLLSSILFPLGVLLCVLGVFALTWSTTRMSTHDDNDNGDDTTTVLATVSGAENNLRSVDDNDDREAGHGRQVSLIKPAPKSRKTSLVDQPIEEGVPMPPAPLPPQPQMYEINSRPQRTIKIHSGGFSPFAMTLEPSVFVGGGGEGGGGSGRLTHPRPGDHHRSSVSNRHHHHHHVDLLTGLNMDGLEEAHHHGVGGGVDASPSHRTGRRRSQQQDRVTPTTTPRSSANVARVVMLNPIIASNNNTADHPARAPSPGLLQRVPSPANANSKANSRSNSLASPNNAATVAPSSMAVPNSAAAKRD